MSTSYSHITLEQIEAAIREIAAAEPNRYYTKQPGSLSCAYAHDSEPGCIFGHVLNRLGVPLENLAEFDAQHGLPIGPVLCELGIVTHNDLYTYNGPRYRILYWLSEVQRCQDRGLTWLAAVTVADSMQDAADTQAALLAEEQE